MNGKFYILFYRKDVTNRKPITDEPYCWTMEDRVDYDENLSELEGQDHIHVVAHGVSPKSCVHFTRAIRSSGSKSLLKTERDSYLPF